MKRLLYAVSISCFLLLFNACDEEDYSNVNITHYEEESIEKIFDGELKGHIVIRDLEGVDVTSVDMGETFYVIDNTEGGADSREWTITKGDETITSKEKFVRLNFPSPGEVTISLTSKRSSDGKTITSEAVVQILSIPVEVDFITVPQDENGVVTIKQGASVAFTSILKGSPTIFEWTIEGPEVLTSTEQNPVVTFKEVGTYKVTFKAVRDDGDEGTSEDVIEKEGFIVVEKLYVDLIRAVATDNKIELQYSNPIASEVPENIEDEYSITINTAKGDILTPQVINVEISGDSSLMLTFDDKMYSDDEVLLSFNAASGDLKDATGIVTLSAFSDEPCVYGKSLAFGDMEDESVWARSSNTATTDGIFMFVDESSAEYGQTPYQGNKCLVIVRGSDKIGVSFLKGYTVQEGDVFEFAYEALTVEVENVPGALGALERRMSLVAGDGSNAAGGNWMWAKDNGNGTGEWTTVRKTINVSADTKGQTGTLYFHFFRYGGTSNDAAIWIDNLRIYIPDPRP